MAKPGVFLVLLDLLFSSCAGTAPEARSGRRPVPDIQVVNHQDLGVHDAAGARAAVFRNLGDTYDLYPLAYDPWDQWCLKRTLYLDAVGYLNGRLVFNVDEDTGRLFRINIIREGRRYIVFIHIHRIFYSLETRPLGIIQAWTQWVFEARPATTPLTR